MGLISTLFRRRRTSAEMCGSDLLREHGTSPLLRVARQLLTAGRSDRALALLRVGVLRFPEDGEVTELLASAERAEALPQVPAAVELVEQEPDAKNHARVSHLTRRAGDEAAALEHGRMSIQADPRSPFGYRAIGQLYLERFRNVSRTVDGMNSLRYLSKACALDPRHATSLLSLAEIFVLLRAPDASRRFLAPVADAHPSDQTVEILERRASELEPEGTSNVQELFLRHERRLIARDTGSTEEATVSEVPPDLPSHLEEFVRTIDGSTGVWVVGANRQVIAGFSSNEYTEAAVNELGIVADTVRSNSSRMGLGQFGSLLLRGEEQLVIITSLGDSLTGFYFGERPSRQNDVEQAFKRVEYSLEETKGATR